MKKIIVFIGLVFTLFASSCTQSKNYESVSSKEAKLLIVQDSTLQVLDVRTPKEVELGSIEGAVIINWYSETFNEELNKLDKKRPLLVYCQSGVRSIQAAEFISKEGFLKVYNLKRGYNSWGK